jgi:hypothetical protein
MRYRHSTDANQKAIVASLRQLGVSVYTNVDDILCGHIGKDGYTPTTYWYEIKSPTELSKRTGEPFKRTKRGSGTYQRQEALKASWKGHRMVVSTLEEILKDMGIS